MCMLKTGKDIQTLGDINNLVIGTLLRQSQTYSSEDIVRAVRRDSDGSLVPVSDEQLNRMIKNDLDLLVEYGNVRCRNGRYVPRCAVG